MTRFVGHQRNMIFSQRQSWPHHIYIAQQRRRQAVILRAPAVVAAAAAVEVAGLPASVQDDIFHAAGGFFELVVHYSLPFMDHAGDARIELAVAVFLALVVARAMKALAQTPSVLPSPRSP